MARRHSTLISLFNDIADQLRAKYKSSDTFKADDFDIAIRDLPAGGADVSDATAVASDLISGKIAYSKDSSGNPIRLTGTITVYNGEVE